MILLNDLPVGVFAYFCEDTGCLVKSGNYTYLSIGITTANKCFYVEFIFYLAFQKGGMCRDFVRICTRLETDNIFPFKKGNASYHMFSIQIVAVGNDI